MTRSATLKQALPGLAVIALSLLIWFQSRTFPVLPEGHPGPGLFPGAIAVGLFLCGFVLTISALRAPEAPAPEDASEEAVGGGFFRIALIVGAILLYPPVSELLGFVATISVISFLVAILLKAKPVRAALTAVIGTLLIYVLFTRLLGVPL